MPEQTRHLDAAQGRSINTIHCVFRSSTAQPDFSPIQLLFLAMIQVFTRTGLDYRNHGAVQRAHQCFDRLLRWSVLHTANGFGVNQGLFACRASPQFDPIMLPHFLRGSTKRFFRPKVRQGPLQGQRIGPMANLGCFTKGPHLPTTPALTQSLLQYTNLSVSRVPGQGFFFRYGWSFGSWVSALVVAAAWDFSAHSVSTPLPNLRICSMALASASCAVQPWASSVSISSEISSSR